MRFKYPVIHEGPTRRALDAEQRWIGRLQVLGALALVLFALGWAGRMDMEDAIAIEQERLERAAALRMAKARAACVAEQAAQAGAEPAVVAALCVRAVPVAGAEGGRP